MHKKRDKNFASQKRTKTKKRTRNRPKRAKPGAFWVLERVAAVGDGCGRILLLEKCTPMVWWWPQQQKDLPAFLTKRCWLELPLKGAPSRRSSLKTCHRHVFLTLGPSRVQVLPRSNEKKSGIAEAIPDFFWQGQKDLVSAPLRSARNLRATGTHSPLGTRFWSGCGRAHQGEGKGRCHPVPSASPREAGAGLVLRALFGEGLCIDYHFFLRKKSTSARRMAKLTRITAG